MPRHDRTGRSKNGPPFLQLFNYIFDCAAYRALTPQERCVLHEVIRRYNGTNNGFLFLSVRDAADGARINKDTANRAFHRLIEIGFLEVASPGAFSLKLPHATEWRLTYAYCDRTSSPASKAFMKWRPADAETTKRGPQSGRRGPN